MNEHDMGLNLAVIASLLAATLISVITVIIVMV